MNDAQSSTPILFVGGPFRGIRQVNELRPQVAIRLGTNIQDAQGVVNSGATIAEYVLVQVGDELQYHVVSVRLQDGRFLVEYVDGPLQGWHTTEQHPQQLPSNVSVGVVREEQRDKSQPYATVTYEKRQGDSQREWRYEFVSEEVNPDVTLQLAIDDNYRQHTDDIFRCPPTGEHTQIGIQDGHRRASVDQLIAPLILECWRCGWDTMGSCQEREDGTAYISFPRALHGEAFHRAAAAEGLEVSIKPSSMTIANTERVEKVTFTTAHAIFSPQLIPSLVTAIQKSRQHS